MKSTFEEESFTEEEYVEGDLIKVNEAENEEITPPITAEPKFEGAEISIAKLGNFSRKKTETESVSW